MKVKKRTWTQWMCAFPLQYNCLQHCRYHQIHILLSTWWLHEFLHWSLNLIEDVLLLQLFQPFLLLVTFLGSAILKPNFHLSWCQFRCLRQFMRLCVIDEFADELEISFQLHTLIIAVDRTILVFGSSFACNNKKRYVSKDQVGFSQILY